MSYIVSFDMKSLFTRVPIEEALQVIEGKLLEDDKLDEWTHVSGYHPQTDRALHEVHIP